MHGGPCIARHQTFHIRLGVRRHPRAGRGRVEVVIVADASPRVSLVPGCRWLLRHVDGIQGNCCASLGTSAQGREAALFASRADTVRLACGSCVECIVAPPSVDSALAVPGSCAVLAIGRTSNCEALSGVRMLSLGLCPARVPLGSCSAMVFGRGLRCCLFHDQLQPPSRLVCIMLLLYSLAESRVWMWPWVLLRCLRHHGAVGVFARFGCLGVRRLPSACGTLRD